MSNNPLTALPTLGQSVWYDNIQRSMLRNNELAHMVKEDDLRGMTTNPTIFQKAITGSSDYDDSLANLVQQHPDGNNLDYFVALALEDIREAADILRPVYDATNGRDGYVSMEVSPHLAHDTEGSIAEAKRLFQELDRPNIMIKIPSTKAGIPTIEHLIAEGINVNATLLFSVERYLEVANAYIRGLEQRHAAGKPIDHIASVASFFVSRVDTLIDKLLTERLPNANADEQIQINNLLGTVAIANAKAAYLRYQGLFDGEFASLRAAGAQPQRLLWASTGTKNADYSDVLYIDNLIGADTVNTIPPTTYNAFKEHGKVEPSLEKELSEAPKILSTVSTLGIDIEAAMKQLEDEGVKAFADSFDALLEAIGSKASTLLQHKAS